MCFNILSVKQCLLLIKLHLQCINLDACGVYYGKHILLIEYCRNNRSAMVVVDNRFCTSRWIALTIVDITPYFCVRISP